jgi:hypothetical protein
MLALKGLFSRPEIFNKMSRIFELQPRISFVSIRTQHYLDSGIRTFKRDPRINASPLPCRLVYEGTWETNRITAFTSVLLSEDSEKSSTLIPDFLQIMQTCWCLCLTDFRHKSLQLMEGKDKPHTGK